MKLEFCFASRLRPKVQVASHSHAALEIVYYAEGKGRIAFSDRHWKFSANDFHIAPAGIAQGLLAQIVGLARRVIAAESAVPAGAARKAGRIEKALHLIRNKEGRVGLDEVSDALYLSKDYLRHLVKESTGQSPLQHILASRMEKAQRLLATTALSVAEVAAQCGFKDIYYFSKFFRRNAGQPPSAWRRRQKSDA